MKLAKYNFTHPLSLWNANLGSKMVFDLIVVGKICCDSILAFKPRKKREWNYLTQITTKAQPSREIDIDGLAPGVLFNFIWSQSLGFIGEVVCNDINWSIKLGKYIYLDHLEERTSLHLASQILIIQLFLVMYIYNWHILIDVLVQQYMENCTAAYGLVSEFDLLWNRWEQFHCQPQSIRLI